MAIEHKDEWLFFVPRSDKEKPQASFVPNFLHDVECLFWMYYWFLYFHVLRDTIATTPTADLLQHTQAVQAHHTKAFDTEHFGGALRLCLICRPAMFLPLELDLLRPLFPAHLLRPLDFLPKFRAEYEVVQAVPPRELPGLGEDGRAVWRLPREAFAARLHDAFEDVLLDALCPDAVPADGWPVVRIESVCAAQEAAGAGAAAERKSSQPPRDVPAGKGASTADVPAPSKRKRGDDVETGVNAEAQITEVKRARLSSAEEPEEP